ncbi:hypothetical protein NIE88_13885 [Sporolactobacillus shoreicorticis]|uniref:Uncharacterized protein n=1 Tax=Sporolactobacillus shoreicorticis TaxID=1923877 RepID=A0ABW5S8K2_9BACL|nr:hypothetical protein [Sporolactobacillus shoreicorticis]MCO7126858.1 hypothetical protein [Sporolactobacillus shoreicorticis]
MLSKRHFACQNAAESLLARAANKPGGTVNEVLSPLHRVIIMAGAGAEGLFILFRCAEKSCLTALS